MEGPQFEALLHQATESERSTGDTLWRAEEFFAGLVALILASGVAIIGLTSDRLLIRSSGIGAFAAGLLAAMLAIAGHYALCLQSYYYVRTRRGQQLMLEALSRGSTDLESTRMLHLLTTPVDRLDEMTLDDLSHVRKVLFARVGSRWAFRIVLGLLVSASMLLAAGGIGLAFCIIPTTGCVTTGGFWNPAIWQDPAIWVSVLLLLATSSVGFWGFLLGWGLPHRFDKTIKGKKSAKPAP